MPTWGSAERKASTEMRQNFGLKRRLQLLASLLFCILLGYLSSSVALAKPTLSFSLPQGLQGFPSFQSFTQQIIEQRSLRQMKTYRWVSERALVNSWRGAQSSGNVTWPLPWTSRSLSGSGHVPIFATLTINSLPLPSPPGCPFSSSFLQWEACEQRLAHYDILSRSDHRRHRAGTPEAAVGLRANWNLVSTNARPSRECQVWEHQGSRIENILAVAVIISAIHSICLSRLMARKYREEKRTDNGSLSSAGVQILKIVLQILYIYNIFVYLLRLLTIYIIFIIIKL